MQFCQEELKKDQQNALQEMQEAREKEEEEEEGGKCKDYMSNWLHFDFYLSETFTL